MYSYCHFFISVKPADVQLSTNATASQTFVGSYLKFTCSVGSANPQVISYHLLRNDSVVDTKSSGMWIRMLSSSGMFTYKCLANNTVGTAKSSGLNIFVGGEFSV